MFKTNIIMFVLSILRAVYYYNANLILSPIIVLELENYSIITYIVHMNFPILVLVESIMKHDPNIYVIIDLMSIYTEKKKVYYRR